MSILSDVGGRLVQSFLSLDDLVFGQSLLRDGTAQFVGASRSAVGAVAITSNVAARAVQLGVQTGAKTAKWTTAPLEGWVPGADVAHDFASRVDARAGAAGEEASLLAIYGLELAGGPASAARDPLTEEPWLNKQIPHGYGWADLAADTAVGPLGRIAALPLTLGLDAFEATAETRAGRLSAEGALQLFHALLSALPGEDSEKVDLEALRENFLSVASSSGASALRDVARIAEALLRLGLGDVRRLREVMIEALDDMEQLADHEVMGELLPGLPAGAYLRRRARSIVENAPRKFIAALEVGPDGEAPSAATVFSALLDDADNLRVFLIEYPQALALLAASMGAIAGAGTLDADDVEDYLRGKGSKTREEDGKSKKRPWSAKELESYAGKAEVVAGADPESGPFPRSAIWLARDVVFDYSLEVLGREKALARIGRLYGETTRERIEADPSLEVEIMDAERGQKRLETLYVVVAESETAELTRRRDLAAEQLANLRTFDRMRLNFRPETIAERIEVLSAFLSLTGQELALRTQAGSTAERLESLADFEAWAGTAA